MRRSLIFVAAALSLAGCNTVQNAAGTPTTYNDPGALGPVKGVGIESQDVVGMTDQMIRDMLAEPRLANAQLAPNVIIDAEYFANESTSRINKNTITDRLRVGLNRAAQGRMNFVGRHYAGMVTSERKIKRAGIADKGSLPEALAQKGGDYRLGGRITSLDSWDPKSGMMSRFTQIVFEMVDLETGEIVWTGLYDFSKSGQDAVIYR
ncbi:MAG: penicillin-binding protein activator LpoB [Magnetospirillum sp.]|nr:penicillin-binding protein activator LpoB [Magnetospirillum sp.]